MAAIHHALPVLVRAVRHIKRGELSMARQSRCATALDAMIKIHCECGKAMPARLGTLKTRTHFSCSCGAIVARDLRQFVTCIEEIEARLTRRASRAMRRGHDVAPPDVLVLCD
jgi:hypothetical protein